jgi:hypothetical protein
VIASSQSGRIVIGAFGKTDCLPWSLALLAHQPQAGADGAEGRMREPHYAGCYEKG